MTKHVRFETKTKDGHTITIKGDPNMDSKTLDALQKLADLVFQRERDKMIRAGICPECGYKETMNAAVPDGYLPGHYLWCPKCDASVVADLEEEL